MDASIEELLRREGKRVNNLSADSPVEDAPGTIPSGDTSSGATPNTKVASTEGDLAHVKLTEMPGSQLGGVTGPASAVEKSEISPEAI